MKTYIKKYISYIIQIYVLVVARVGLEPTRDFTSTDFKSAAAANYATRPNLSNTYETVTPTFPPSIEINVNKFYKIPITPIHNTQYHKQNTVVSM